MQHFFNLLFITICLQIGCSRTANAQVTPSTADQPDEYDILSKQGDELFAQGRYEDAIKKYRSSIGGKPETEEQAKKKIERSQFLIGLKNDAQKAVQENRSDLAVDKWKRVISENRTDGITKRLLGNYYGDLGSKALAQKKYDEAKANFALALSYDPDNTTWQAQRDVTIQLMGLNTPPITKTEPVAKSEPQPPLAITTTTVRTQTEPVSGSVPTYEPAQTTVVRYKRNLVPKVFTLLAGAGAGYYAHLLRTDYNKRLTILNQVSGRVDGDGDNIIIGSPVYTEWEIAYNNAQAAYNKKGLASACVGVAVVAAIAEGYLFIKKRKPRDAAFRIGSSSDSYGLAMRLRLK